MHWLYRLVPASRAQARGWRLITWALFGDDDSGIFGEHDHYAGEPQTLWTFVRWQLRNPAANLFKHVLAWPRDPRLVLARYDGEHWSWLFEEPQGQKWIFARVELTVAALPPGIWWKSERTEGYWLFHSNGWLSLLPTLRCRTDK